MGNVVSSLVMYALQIAWFCQRLIDRDYRENHGSRTRPILGTQETNLDIFLSKCRTYYLSQRNRTGSIQFEESKTGKKLKRDQHDSPLENVNGADNLHFDNNNILFKSNLRVSLSEPDFTTLNIKKNDHAYEYLQTKLLQEFSKRRVNSHFSKAERPKRKKITYGKREKLNHLTISGGNSCKKETETTAIVWWSQLRRSKSEKFFPLTHHQSRGI